MAVFKKSMSWVKEGKWGCRVCKTMCNGLKIYMKRILCGSWRSVHASQIDDVSKDRESVRPWGAPSCRRSFVPPSCSSGPLCTALWGDSTWPPGWRRSSAALWSGCEGTGPRLCIRSLDHCALNRQTDTHTDTSQWLTHYTNTSIPRVLTHIPFTPDLNNWTKTAWKRWLWSASNQNLVLFTWTSHWILWF